MKHVILSILLCLFSLHTSAQLSESTLDSIIVELQHCDQLQLKYNETDSLLTVTLLELGERKQDIREYKLTISEYKSLVQKLEEEKKIVAVLTEEDRKRLRKARGLNILLIAADVILLILLL